MPLIVEVVAPDRVLWQGEATEVSAPAAEGSMGVLPGHQPVLSVLQPGVVKIKPTQGESVEVEVEGGFFSVDTDRVTVVIDATATVAAAAGLDSGD